ncbi:hypothetical protein PVK06_025847 [Gossypium arboreum]|uniref:Reverse transcriptase domain-containing protein n=1 Tax=Gossypium arboreum TaxID=29729 RepID=A0ABR0NX54_GOSAR|nr:hypothetical protein PVK06_025847 [Gossypium arboreum]
MVVNHLQKVLDNCLDDSQSAFGPGRLITDNVLLAYKVLHSFMKERWAKRIFGPEAGHEQSIQSGGVAFIQCMMLKLGFVDSFVDIILRCIKSVQYSILNNGEEGSSFNPSRGLRQGDRLSPYLFCSVERAFLH